MVPVDGPRKFVWDIKRAKKRPFPLPDISALLSYCVLSVFFLLFFILMEIVILMLSEKLKMAEFSARVLYAFTAEGETELTIRHSKASSMYRIL